MSNEKKKSLLSLVADAYAVPLMCVCCSWCVMLLSVVFFVACPVPDS
jgi:hypothetical protein